jgi:hypothetical protein
MPDPVTWPEQFYALIEVGERRETLAVCVAHRGAHVYDAGACIGFAAGRQPARLRHALYRQARALEREQAAPPEPIRVEIDAERLAAGIALALDQLMERRRQQGRESRPEPAPTTQASEPAIRGVTVARVGDGD